jgi:gentisate 1,2-dioxygenase
MDSTAKKLDVKANAELYMEQVRFGQSEEIRRREAPVHVRREEHEQLLRESTGAVYIVDPRLGFNNRTHRFWINKLPPGGEEGQKWKTLGHRHTVEAVIYWLSGHGYSIIDGIRYDWGPGDIVCVPMFAWHRHVNESDEFAYYTASTTGPLSMGIGQAVYEDERFPQFFVHAQSGEAALRSLLPGGADIGETPNRGRASKSELIYAEQLAFAFKEEKARRQSKVIVRATEVNLETSPMGRVAYIVDARMGFHVKALGTLIAEVPPGKHSGSHRHLYDEIDYVLEGEGEAIIDDKRYEIKKGDTLAIPVFAWHQYFARGDKPLRLLVHHTRHAMENLGLTLTQHGELANYE